MRLLIRIIAGVVLLTGCQQSALETYPPTEHSLDGVATSGGVTAVLGPRGLSDATSRISNRLFSTWHEGLALTGEVVVPAPDGSHSVKWDDFLVSWRSVELAISPNRIELVVRLEAASPATLTTKEDDHCTVDLLANDLSLNVPIELSSSRVGQIETRLASEPRIHSTTSLFNWELCLPDNAADERLLDTVVGGAIAQQLGAALNEVELVRSADFGLDLAFLATVSGSIDDALGDVTFEVRATENEDVPAWVLGRDLQVYVPFRSAIDTNYHPCTPPNFILPALTQDVIPDVATEGVLIHSRALAHALLALWAAGYGCGESLEQALDLDLTELATLWPALTDLGPETTLRVRHWPVGTAALDFKKINNDIVLTMETGRLDLEVLGTIDDALVTLFGVTLEATIQGTLTLETSGIHLTKGHVVASKVFGTTENLMSAPSNAAITWLVDQVVAARIAEFHVPFPLVSENTTEYSLDLVGAFLLVGREQSESQRFD